MRIADRVLNGGSNDYLGKCCGVVHVGANSGQERALYARYDLDVLWIEPIPDVFAQLRRNIRRYPKQRALNALITDRNGDTKTLHIANNGGQSSSILDLKLHRDIWPDVTYVDSIQLPTRTLGSVLGETDRYDALVLDTQGSELLVLQGAGDARRFTFIKTEAADFESYAGCATVDALSDFLGPRGFEVVRRDKFAERPRGGAYYELLFERAG